MSDRFKREHHRRVARVLEALDARLLEQNACLFGGGTAIALRFGEYRESVDVDFIVSDRAGYRALRQRMNERGMDGIARGLTQAREVRADQYGIRTLLAVDGVDVKFEIVLEGRVALEPPGKSDRLCGVATLTKLDMATTKLLALSDRWADDAVHSRDLIDLAMMSLPATTLRSAAAKAAGAYGDSIERDLRKAIDTLRARPGRLEQCMVALHMTTLSPAAVWQRIRKLRPAASTTPPRRKSTTANRAKPAAPRPKPGRR